MRALLDIALQQEDRPVILSGISDRQSISAKYLEHLLGDLRKAGIVRSFRGARGGFELNRPPSEIPLLDVVRTLETDFGTTECVTDPDHCPRAQDCVVRAVWAKVSDAMCDTLAGLSLADLMEQSKRMESSTSDMGWIDKLCRTGA
jgi:Rrf2 family protein